MKTPIPITNHYQSIYSVLRVAAIVLISIFFSSISNAAVSYLVTDKNQVTGLNGDATDNTFDPNVSGATEATLGKDEYNAYSFYVELNEPISLTDTQGLVVMFGRWNNEGSPKATRVEGLNEEGNWDLLGYAYMQFRGGKGTVEYSKPIYVSSDTEGKKYSKLKFTVLKTALGYAEGDKVRFNKFNVFLLGKGEEYPDGRIDPWRLNTDYYTTYKDYTFKPTHGILDPRNHYGKNIDYPTETPWGENNTFQYEGRTYELPTFHMQGDNQMPHVTEHTVYVMPGEIIPLLPYYDMPRNGRYYAKFSHWYKYNADINGVPQPQDYGHVVDSVSGERLLDFLVDPAGIFYTDNVGYFGGNALPKSSRIFVIRSVDDLLIFSEMVANEGESALNAILAADLNLEGVDFPGIGTATVSYTGTFNGNGHTVSNMNLTGSGNETLGFFRKVASGFSVKNLRLDNCDLQNGGTSALLIGEVETYNVWGSTGAIEISNVMVSGTLSGSGMYAGIVGKVGSGVTTSMSNVGYIGSINSSSESAALIGSSGSLLVLENCYADAYVQKYKSDSYNGNYFAAVNTSSDNVTFNNCIFNLRSSNTKGNLEFFASQTGVDAINCGYSVQLNKTEHPDYSKPLRIYIAKESWKDFVLYINQWGTEQILVGCQGWEEIEGIEYGYFEPNMNEWYEYSIVPYIGDSELDENNFSWSIPGLMTACEIEGSQHNKDEYIILSLKEFSKEIAENPVMGKWPLESGFPIPPMSQADDEKLVTNLDYDNKFLSNKDATSGVTIPQGWYGTSATFFKPLDTSKAPDHIDNLKLGSHSFDIAVDFSHEFDATSNHNLSDDEQAIYSPIINYRHIFHVVSGKDFADSVTNSTEANKKYLMGKKRIVYAPVRDGKKFYVRLPTEFPVPYKRRPNKDWSIEDNIYSSTNFYYKSDATHYERASGFDIEIYKDGTKISDSRFGYGYNEEAMFDFEETPKNAETYNFSQGIRQYYENGPTYYTAGGEGVVYRMLECKNPEVGTYTVRIYALDDTGKPLHIWNDENSRIYMMEYEITFLGEDDASVKLESDIPSLHKDSYLSDEDVCGDPVVFLNFDEYRAFEDADRYNQDDYFQHAQDTYNNEYKSFKWPTIWSQCSYSFGYGEYSNYDYNEYLIANHVSQVPWAAACKSDDVRDRLYYDTKDSGNPEMGYFYYVNAASDPGVTSRLRIERLCIGSTVVVTGWINDFSGTTYADVAFNFTAVMKDGSRQRIHSFISEPVDTSGEWYHVYYSFVPELPETINPAAIDHYEIEVENNCQSSDGADYAVDDIRAYIVTPEITATQLSPMCDNEEASTGIQLRTRFDKLLASQGVEELEDDAATGDNETEKPEDMCTVYVAMFDKALYDSLLADENVSSSEALAGSVVKLEDKDRQLQDWISFKMSKNFKKLIPFDPNNPEEYYLTPLGSTSAKGVNYLIANIKPDGKNIKVGKRYLVSIRLVDGSVANTEEMTLEHFSVSEDDCAKYGVLTLQGSGIVKVDGFAYTTDDEIKVCAGQAPVLQVELLKVGEDTKTVSKEKYYYDWFLGPMDGMSDEEFIQLTKFRIDYKDETEIPVADRRVQGFEDLSDDEYAALVNKYAAIAALVEDGVLFLHQSSFVFPKISTDPDFNKNLVVTAFPIIDEQKEDGEKVCGGASEIRLKVHDTSPGMYDGFPDMDYPGYMTDVPLRVGLRQLREVSTKVTDPENIKNFTRRLEVPLRAIMSYKGVNADAEMRMSVTDKHGNEVDPFVYIVESNDPLYMDLVRHPGKNEDLVDPSLELTQMDDYGVLVGLLPVGLVTGMTAVKGNDNNAVEIVFSKDMQFREGYYYRMRFDFNETMEEGQLRDVCDGQVVFTIKVVPEYQRWTGNASRNWNNDANWTRIAKSELFLGDDDTKIGEDEVAAADHTSDKSGNNTNIVSYAPMDFTKVIIPNVVDNFPLMFERKQTDVKTLHGNEKWDEADSDTKAAHHSATKDIKYDMVSLSLNDVLACRPWYANTCEQIHFRYGAELQLQQHFKFRDNYQKAWVDLETQPYRWYTLSTPLKQVVAGDMYTISEGSKQNTELFSDIKFDNKIYGRFDPAVYQRSWNRAGEAELYRFEGDNTHTDVSAGVSLNWSRVYNQVDVDYSGGQGFSINTQPRFTETLAEGEEKDETVRFRLPKADDTYSYYDMADNTEDVDDKALAERDERHSLNDVPMTATLEAKEKARYFLTGNPFIARMDMAEFFKENTNLTGKYWIMSGDRQDAYLWNADDDNFISTSASDEQAGIVAPMQGFFVEAAEETSNLNLKFTADMIKVTDGEGSAGPLRIVRNVVEERLFNVVASVGDVEISRAVIRLAEDADAVYNASEDVAMIVDKSLDIPTAVYTSASGNALSINSLERIERTEVGVTALPETHTILRFEGVDEAEGLKLLDTATGETVDLYEGLSIDVEGSSAGRFYIVCSIGNSVAEELSVSLSGRIVSVAAPTEGIVARAFDASGVCLGEWISDGSSLSFDVAPGVIVVEVTADGNNLTRKFIVK